MDWARILAYVTGLVDQELPARTEYLAAENRILKAQLKGRLKLSDAERASLGENRSVRGVYRLTPSEDDSRLKSENWARANCCSYQAHHQDHHAADYRREPHHTERVIGPGSDLTNDGT